MARLMAVAAVFAATFTAAAQGTSAAGLIQTPEQAVQQGQYEQADVLYARAASGADSPSILPALWYLGVRAAGQGNRLAAEGFFDRLLKIDGKGPLAPRALTWLGNLRKEDPAGAE